MKLDGSDVTRLTANELDFDTDPAWCGASKVVFARQAADETDYDIYIMDLLDGGNLTRLTNNSEDNNGPIHDRWTSHGFVDTLVDSSTV